LCEQAEQFLAGAEPAAAETAARDALQRAAAVNCKFRWGAAEARHLLGQALAAQGHLRRACSMLRKALHLRRRLGDPKTGLTERLLKLVSERSS
jgi:hypothetical protein